MLGAAAGTSFGNTFAAAAAQVELPVSRRLEVDARAQLAPLESHIALGRGYAASGGSGPLVWLTPRWGLSGLLDANRYSVTSLAKSDAFWHAAVVTRQLWWANPTRLSLGYFRALRSSITPSGVEPNHLQGGELLVESRLGCSGRACYRFTMEFAVGQLLDQGNPQCDGTLTGPATCPRHSSISGGAVLGFLVELPRRKGTEDAPF